MITPRRSTPARRLAMVAVVAGLLTASCGGDDDSDADSNEQATDAQTDAETEPAADEQGDEPAADDTATEEPADPPKDASEAIEEDGAEREESVDVTLPPEENADPVVGGTLRYGLEADVNGLNPTASNLSAPGLTMGNAVFDTLAAFTPDGGWTPYLAESFTPNEDNTQWTVKLREGITFHDGTPLDAEAILANFEAQRSHPVVGLAVKPFFPETGGVTVVDDLTATFNLLEPNAKFPTSMASQLGMVASPTWLAAAAQDGTLNQAPVGTGPFRFDGRSEDSVTRFVRNDEWWGGEVYLDAVEFFPVPDDDTRTDLLFNGELEALQTTNQGSILDLTADPSIQNILIDKSEESFAMINSAAAPFDDIRARKALTLATPVDLYNELIGLGVNRPADQIFTPESPYFNPNVVQEHDDPEGALALVAEYCAERGGEEQPTIGGPTCTDGKINIEYQWAGPSVVDTRIADLLIQGWSEAGFNVTRDEILQSEHISQTALGQYNVSAWRQFGAENPTDDRVWLMCRNVDPAFISINWPRYCDESRDALILQIAATDDEAELVPLYQELSQKLHDDYLYVFYNHTMWNNAFTENVHGVCDRTAPDDTALLCASNGRTWFSSVWLS